MKEIVLDDILKVSKALKHFFNFIKFPWGPPFAIASDACGPPFAFDWNFQNPLKRVRMPQK